MTKIMVVLSMMVSNRIIPIQCLVVCVLLLIALGVGAAPMPKGSVIVGFTGLDWQVYHFTNQKYEKLPALSNSRNISYSLSQQQITFVASDASLQTYLLSTQKLIPSVNDQENRYTQPKYSVNGKRLFVVRLKKGTSRSTEIVEFSDKYDPFNIVVRKRTAQFDPYMLDDEYLYYTTALCVNDCIKMIWELWRRNMFTGEQEQLTLLNAVSRQPILNDKNMIYFSSNKAGYYHIWRMEAKVNGKAEQLTTGEVKDSNPALDKDSNLYFIRRTSGSVNIMKRFEDGHLEKVDLPPEIEDIRDLEIHY